MLDLMIKILFGTKRNANVVTASTEPPITPSAIQTVRFSHISSPTTETLTKTTYTDQEQLKEWSNVLGLTAKKDTANTPKSGWTQTIYGEGTATTAQLVGYSANGVGHSVPQQESMDLAFFGITN